MTDLFINRGAEFSPCGLYRYKLWRIWDQGAWPLAFVMLNPSTADESVNDPTVERCERRARQIGFGGLIVVNIFGWCSTDPRALRGPDDIIGPENDDAIIWAASKAGMVICGWGAIAEKVHSGRPKWVLDLIRSTGKVPHALKLNADGSPQHPLYVGYDVEPAPMKVLR